LRFKVADFVRYCLRQLCEFKQRIIDRRPVRPVKQVRHKPATTVPEREPLRVVGTGAASPLADLLALVDIMNAGCSFMAGLLVCRAT